jgi:hypothetical protein
MDTLSELRRSKFRAQIKKEEFVTKYVVITLWAGTNNVSRDRRTDIQKENASL